MCGKMATTFILLLVLITPVVSQSSCTLNESTWNCTVYDDTNNGSVTVDDRLKALEAKLKKFDAVLEGMQMMCSHIAKLGNFEDEENSVEESGIDVDIDVNHSSNKAEDHLEDFNHEINLGKIESGGLIDGNIEVVVKFLTGSTCRMVWFLRYENSSFIREQGNMKETLVPVVGKGTNKAICVSTIVLADVDILESCIVNIYTTNEDIQLNLNLSSLQDKGSEEIGDFEFKVLKFTPTKVIGNNILESSRVSMTVEVTQNVVDRLRDHFSNAYTIFTYLNTTTEPPVFNEAWGFHDDITVDVKNGSDNVLVLGIGEELSKFPGFLSLRVDQKSTKYLESYGRGVRMRLIRKGSANILPTGIIAVWKQEEIQYYREQYHSLSCAGASIPTPNVEIFKEKSDGKLKKLTPDLKSVDDIFNSQSINFGPNDDVKPEGNYVCRVSLGNKYVDTKIAIEKYVDIEFDEKKTGLVKNTSKETHVSCKASGNPVPELKLLMNDRYGANIMTSDEEIYSVKVMTRKDTSRVLLKIVPPNPDLSTIVCVAKQKLGGNTGPIRYFPIEIKKAL